MKEITRNYDQLLAVVLFGIGVLFLTFKFGFQKTLLAMGMGYAFFFILFISIGVISLITFGTKNQNPNLTVRLLKGTFVGGAFILIGSQLKYFWVTIDFSSSEVRLVTFFMGLWFVVFSPKIKKAFEQILFKGSPGNQAPHSEEP